MPKVITFDRFELGIDLRKGRAVADANRLRDLKNGYVTPGWHIQKRPGITSVGDLTAGSKGLIGYNGKLATFSAVSNPVHNTTDDGVDIDNYQLPYSANASDDATDVHFAQPFNNKLYVAMEYASGNTEHHYIDGVAPYHVTDVNCPHSKEVIKMQSKIYAVGYGTDTEVVGYSATDDPTDWTLTDDAGFLPVGIRAPGSANPQGLGNFNDQLVVFMDDAAQVWALDPDPTLNALTEVIGNLGCEYNNTIGSISGDLFFLSPVGFRSIALQSMTDNLEDLDVGTPIDSLITDDLLAGNTPLAIYYTGGGQYICFIGTTAFVYSYSRTAKVSAWSYYELPFSVDAVAPLNNELYLRSGDTLYKFDAEAYTDDGDSFEVLIELPYQAFKKPSVLKHLVGCDLITKGTGTIQHRYDSSDVSLITTEIPFSGDTRPGPTYPVDLSVTEVAPVIKNHDDEDFAFYGISYLFENLGVR